MSWAQKPRQTEVTSFVLLAQISKQAPEARDRAEEHASRGIAEWAYSSGMESPGFCQSFKESFEPLLSPLPLIRIPASLP